MARMHAILALVLLATQDPATSPPAAAAASAPAPGVTSAATPAPLPSAASAVPPASAALVPSPTAAAVPALTPPTIPAVAVRPQSPAFLDKLSLADRLFVAGDFRNALFAYQDAVYLDPNDARARVRLGRSYAAMRYPAQAQAQYEKALELDPELSEARRAIEELRSPPAATVAAAATPAAPIVIPAAPAARPATTPAVAAEPAAPRPVVRVYKLPVEADEASAPRREPATAPVAEALADPAPSAPSPAQRYRAALDLMAKREYARAVTELDDAIAQDPRLAVAYVARASAQFGLARYREAADDYKAALGLDPNMATPLYGLAECQRLLGHGDAAELYRRYAESRAPDVREDLRALAKKRAGEVRKH
jgi:tetratricopeptide (TPR) repeat protein